ncbi:class A beta-lactamase-related serine hydrolase [Streptomyces sp. NBC_01723]|uniref:serine hydrolase n=1 Tax=unclassified Streptomyces TaxID=2593676 RepID=UPI0027D88CA9|nr:MULTISPECIES: serine hydrolase [unclassified Streptomyces]
MHENPPVRRRGRSRREQRRRRRARRRRMTWTVTSVVILVSGATTYAITRSDPGDSSALDRAKAPSPTAVSARAKAGEAPADAPKPPPSPAPSQKSFDLGPALAPVTALFGDNRMSVAMLDVESGAMATYGHDAFDTASVVKVDILATLLLQAQDQGRRLSTEERAQSAAMIQKSDNDSTSALWTRIGSARGLDAANERLGLLQTRGGHGTVWGITQTTAEDQIRLLQSVFGDKSPLSEASRTYIQDLMRHVVGSQTWGVSAAADSGTTALKNGWLKRTQTKKWDVNSIGRIEHEGHVYLMAVLLNGCSTQEVGISIVEQAARASVTAFSRKLGETSAN